MKHIVTFSGGKDSEALLAWAEDNLDSYVVVTCDTKWEHPITYAHIKDICSRLTRASEIHLLPPPKYPQGMPQLVRIKRRVPSAKARFCTEALKVDAMLAFLATLPDEYTVYQGIRRNESESRSRMLQREWSDTYDAWVERPCFHYSAQDCFDAAKAKGWPINPLYLMGAGRVGCFPCVLINLRELKAMLADPDLGPMLKARVIYLEFLTGRSFFEPSYIPDRFLSGFDPKSGKKFCRAKDVFEYVESVDRDQLPLLPERSCMSVYNLCE